MILDLPDTSTRKIAAALLDARENYSLATGRVLTLLVAVRAHDSVTEILNTVREATRSNPARVLVLVLGDAGAATRIDAQLIVGADAGASEIVVMQLHGELTAHQDAVVTPLLLPDTPVVAWWPTFDPPHPAQDQLGALSARRITSYDTVAAAAAGYQPGDSDMMWSRITRWRGVVASALDRCPGAQVACVDISGRGGNPSVDIAAAWLASALGVPVTRHVAEEATERSPIASVTMHSDAGDISVETLDARTVAVTVPGRPATFVALSPRTDAECLAEELRHLGPDATYGRALEGVN